MSQYSMPSHPSSVLARRVTVRKRSDCTSEVARPVVCKPLRHLTAAVPIAESRLFAPVMEVRNAPYAVAVGSTYESHFYPALRQSTLVHLHSASAPFVPVASAAPAAKVLIWRDPSDTCIQLTDGISIHVDWFASLGLVVVRYRVVLLAWSIGIACLILALQIRVHRETGEWSAFPIRFNEPLRLRCTAGAFPAILPTMESWLKTEAWKLCVALLAGAVVQASPLGLLLPHPEHLLLGTDQLLLVPLVPVIVTVCITLVSLCAVGVTCATTALAFCLQWTRLLRFPR